MTSQEKAALKEALLKFVAMLAKAFLTRNYILQALGLAVILTLFLGGQHFVSLLIVISLVRTVATLWMLSGGKPVRLLRVLWHGTLAQALFERSQYDLVEPILIDSIEEASTSLTGSSLGRDELILLYLQQAKLYSERGNLEEAQVILEKLVFGSEGGNPILLTFLASVYCERGFTARAKGLVQRALGELESKGMKTDREEATALLVLAQCLTDEHKFPEAKTNLEKALDLYKRSASNLRGVNTAGSDDLALLYLYMAYFLRQQRDYEGAEKNAQEAMRYLTASIGVGRSHSLAGHCFAEQSWIFILLGKYREAKQMSERALRVLDGALANRGRPMALVCMTLAVVELRNGQVVEAERLLGKTFQLLEKQLSPDHPDIAEALVCRAACYQAAGKYKAADEDFLRALSILNSRYPHMDLLVASVRLMHEDFRRKYAHLL